MSIDEEKVEEFVGQVVGDVGATVSSALAHVGHRLGLYRAMAGAGPLTPAELAERTGTQERYVREWLNNQAAGGYIEYHPTSGTFTLPPEHAFVLANEDSPVYMAAAWEQMAAVWAIGPKIEAAFQSGDGVAWHEQDPRLFGSTESFFKPAYRASLLDQWIPPLDGVEGKLEKGGRVACRLRARCLHHPARRRLSRRDDHRVRLPRGLDLGRPQTRGRGGCRGSGQLRGRDRSRLPAPRDGYNLICFFDALHDLGDPVGAAVHARQTLAEDGTVMLVEIRAEDRTEDNLNPFGRLGYGMSTFVCTPNSLSQDVGYALGGQAGPAAIGEVFERAGFTRFRQVAETPVHQVLEARP